MGRWRGSLVLFLSLFIISFVGCSDDSVGPEDDLFSEDTDLELLEQSEVVEDFVVAAEQMMDGDNEDGEGDENPEARRLLRRARILRQQAAIAIRNGNFREARRLLEEARRLTIRAIVLIRGEEAVTDLLERVNELITKAEEELAEDFDEQAQEILDRAIEFRDMAETALADGNLEEALGLLFRARELTMRSIAILKIDDVANNFLQRVDELIAEVSGLVAENPNERAEELLGRAMELRDEAESAIGEESYRQAIRMLERARELLRRAKRIVSAASEG